MTTTDSLPTELKNYPLDRIEEEAARYRWLRDNKRVTIEVELPDDEGTYEIYAGWRNREEWDGLFEREVT